MDLQKFRHEIVIWLSTYETSLRNHRIIHISINFYTRKLTAERSNIKIRGKHVDWTWYYAVNVGRIETSPYVMRKGFPMTIISINNENDDNDDDDDNNNNNNNYIKWAGIF